MPDFPGRSVLAVPCHRLVLLVASLLFVLPAAAEVCWDYTDFENALVPLKCVQMGDMTTPCTWNPTCNTDLDPSDCCVAAHDPLATQTIGEMHVKWHQCMGNVGTAATPPPPNRGLRWYAFHRQFESDFNVYREGLGFGKIDSLEWCPGMNMPYGHFGANQVGHPLGCGTGINRPNNVTCDGCEAFRQCLYVAGAGPISCPSAPASGCSAGGVTFPYTQLEDFQNVDEIATLLDAYFHGNMHGAVADADGGGYNTDCASPNCSTRDAMFWRLHKSLDDVVRAWQDMQAVDVTLVVDRSGSMSAPSGTGSGTRLENAVEAAEMFGDLLEDGRSDGGVNRIGIVSYSTNASNAALNLPLQDVDPTLLDPAGSFATTLAALTPSGSTSIGAGIVAAVDQLCPGGSCATYVAPPGENERKAILLLTDGLENTAPCLEAGCQWGGTGAAIDYTTLDVTQLCAVGLGNAASINGELLTILAERQGGIYLNDTDATGNDLKDFFAKCFAQLTDEFLGLDPAGLLAAHETAGPIVPYDSCDDSRITFTSGWTQTTLPGDRLQLLVTMPNGAAWVPAAGITEESSRQSWAFKRTPLPHHGQSEGTWTMQLVRPQKAFVNGFTTDSFVDPDQGIRLVRREIQRLCPFGEKGQPTCERVLHFEDGARGPSVYEGALKEERGSTVGDVEAITDARAFDELLQKGGWDLVVYARQAGRDEEEPYDEMLAKTLCSGTRAIVTDTRTHSGAAEILRCAGAVRDPKVHNQKTVAGSEHFLRLEAALADPGHATFSYGVQPVVGNATASAPAAHFGPSAGPSAILASSLAGSDLYWHKNVLVRGLSQLTAFAPRSVPRTGAPIRAGVRILPSFLRPGGYPGARMTVEVERPLRGLGGMVERGGRSEGVEGDPVNLVETQLGKLDIPTTKEIYRLNDSGEQGDENPHNGAYTLELPLDYAVDGMYTFHYRFEYPADSCTTRRELKQTLYVDVDTSPAHSEVQIGTPIQGSGATVYPVRIRPQDALGNVVGPGRLPRPSCSKPCECGVQSVVDRNDGSYTIPVRVAPGADLAACTLDAFGAGFTFGQHAKGSYAAAPVSAGEAEAAAAGAER
ncbi:MAG TPA: vWA domain-containing protein [Thermoanaerobaculia bacterium]|nr:vWA domain-containing protein [Thermoanaerobaculia bacterium]